MMRARWVLVCALALAAVAVAVSAVVGETEHASTAQSLDPGQVLAASARLYPQSHLFGDPVHVEVDAIADRRALDPRLVSLDANWSPYAPATPLVRTQTNVGSYTKLVWHVELACLTVQCVPQQGSLRPTSLEPSTIRYNGRAHGGRTVTPITISWPPLRAVSRIDPQDLTRRAVISRQGPSGQIRAAAPPWRVSTRLLAPVSYALSPPVVFWTALALALGLVVGAAALLRPYLPGVQIRRRAPARSRLERALEAVESARGGLAEDERKALELLAAELRRNGRNRLAWTATTLAWSAARPEEDRTLALTDGVRRELAGRTNGRAG